MDPVDCKTDEKPTSALIIGCGPAGLINARTLVNDGFAVTMVAKEDGIGGCWRNTYPDLTTNSPWGSFTFSGLNMPKPSNHKGDVVPARTYRRYLEDFYHHFVEGKAEVLLQTEIIYLRPTHDEKPGWTANMRNKGLEETRSFDKVILATGYLGKPYTPDLFNNSPFPTFHSSALSFPTEFDKLLATIPSPSGKPNAYGDENTVLVVGGGKSAMDIAAVLANRGKKVVWTFRGPLKWFSPSVPPGMMGGNRLDIMFGPSRIIDSWAMWFWHYTSFGAGWVKAFWGIMRKVWSTSYTDNGLEAPQTDPFLSLPHFAGGVPTSPTDFLPLLKAGRIASVKNARPISVDEEGVVVNIQDGENIKIRCGAIVTATGYRGGTYDFLEAKTRQQLGIDCVPGNSDFEEKALEMRKKWKTVQSDVVENTRLPLVFRGILPFGRFAQKDLAITGATKPFYIPALTYEVESHWISSLFKNDHFLNLPETEEECLKEIEADNNFTRARYPGINPYDTIPSGTYFAGFNDLSYSRVLLRDMSLDPWRQKDPATGWWKFWSTGWLDIRVNPEQYATLGEERKNLREKSV